MGSAADSALELKHQRPSRDEMNLAEFPLTVLSTRTNSSTKTLEFHDVVKGKSGEVINRSWIITGADKFGLPTSSDDEVLLGLLKLTVDDGFRDRKIFFTRYELLRILRWTTEGRSYSRLQKALDRLSGVRIKATNAFYDNELKSHNTRNFGIIDGYEINDGRNTTPKPSFFAWSDVIFKSFQAGFIKKLDLEFYLNLRSAVSKRLYRFLDKHFWYKSRIEMNLFTLAHEKIGISRNFQFASSLRQQLDPALEELKEKGFLSRYNYEGKGRETVVQLFAYSEKPRQIAAATVAGQKTIGIEAAPNDANLLKTKVSQMLVQRGLRPGQCERLLKESDVEQLERIRAIVEYFDTLVASGSRLVSRSPIGFLYRAVENPDNFTLPGEAAARAVQTRLQLEPQAHQPEARKPDSERLEADYLVARQQELRSVREKIEPEVLRKIEKEVESALIKLKALISPARFEEAVRHGVDEKLAKLFAIPNFEEWASSRKYAKKGAA